MQLTYSASASASSLHTHTILCARAPRAAVLALRRAEACAAAKVRRSSSRASEPHVHADSVRLWTPLLTFPIALELENRTCTQDVGGAVARWRRRSGAMGTWARWRWSRPGCDGDHVAQPYNIGSTCGAAFVS
eukprot:scaffold286796_cov32-Tisochrysis_lutea.AAC.4